MVRGTAGLHDAAGQRRRMSLDTGEVVQYGWDAMGRLAETTDPQGQVTRFTYDAAGRRTGASYGNGTRATYGYDAVGQVRISADREHADRSIVNSRIGPS